VATWPELPQALNAGIAAMVARLLRRLTAFD
jgi:hypothetical protein